MTPGQDGLLGLAAHPDVAGRQVLVRVAPPAVRDPVAALLEVLVHAVDEERHPADAGLEEGDAQRGWRSNTPPLTSAVIAAIWSNGKLMQCTWM